MAIPGLVELPEEVLLGVCSFLRARDLGWLSCVSRRFAFRSGSAEGAAWALQRPCIVEDVARLWVACCNDQERGWVPTTGLESNLCLMHQVEMLRLPLAFGRAHAGISPPGGALATKNGRGEVTLLAAPAPPALRPRVAANKAVMMRYGRHFAQFTVKGREHYYTGRECDLLFGVIRSDYDVEGGVSLAYS